MLYRSDAEREYFVDALRRYAARLTRQIEDMGATRDRADAAPNCVLLFKFATPRDQAQAWCLDSLAWACEAATGDYDPRASDAQRACYVMRGLLQARQYMGAAGGFWPGGLSGDAAGVLQAWLEQVALKWPS